MKKILLYNVSDLIPAGAHPDPDWRKHTGFNYSPVYEGKQAVVVTFSGPSSSYARQLRFLHGWMKTVVAEPGETEAGAQARATVFADAVVADFNARLTATGDANDVVNMMRVAHEISRNYRLVNQPWDANEE